MNMLRSPVAEPRAPAPDALRQTPMVAPEAIRDICYFEDGVLYVAASHVRDQRVLAWEMDLFRLGVLTRKQQCSQDEISHRTAATSQRKSSSRAGQELEVGLELIGLGVRMKASDLHFVFRQSDCLVKYRVDGFLDAYTAMDRVYAQQVVSALYVHSDVKNRGQFSFDAPIAARINEGLPAGLYACRFASIGTEAGGAVVLRLLYDTVANRSYKTEISLSTLGFSAEQCVLLEDMASAPNGLIIIDGPTGSGKSTTLKYTLQWVHQEYPQFNILTVEDPPEYPITGAQQIPVLVQSDDAEDLTKRSRAYANIISTTLRLDPDILMVGEIRDGTSALAALRAAITGHRLWTTLHANDAWEAMNRLLDLLREAGMEDPMSVLANTQNLTGLIAQRLVPTLCPHCKVTLADHMARAEAHRAALAQVADRAQKTLHSARDPAAIRDAQAALQRATAEIASADAAQTRETLVLNELMAAVDDLDTTRVFVRGEGCEHCVPNATEAENRKFDRRRGILGRTVVAEIVRPDQGLLDVAREGGIPRARQYWMEHRSGKLLADQAIAKIRDGLVDPFVARDFIGPLITAQQVVAQLRRNQIS